MEQPQWPSGSSQPPHQGFPAPPGFPPAPPPAGPPQGGSPRTDQTRPYLLGALGGAVVVVIVGAILIAVGAAHFGGGSSSAGTSRAAVHLPESLGSFEDISIATASRGDKHIGSFKANQANVTRLTEAAYRQAYRGAGVGFRQYSDRALDKFVSVIAVRASSPGLTIGPVADPAYLGLAVNQRQVVQIGDVSCIIFQEQEVPTGSRPDPANEITNECQRTGPKLTVTTMSDLSGPGGRQTMVSLTDEAFTAVSK